MSFLNNSDLNSKVTQNIENIHPDAKIYLFMICNLKKEDKTILLNNNSCLNN